MSTKVLFHYNNQYNYHNKYDWLTHGYYVIECMDYGERMLCISLLKFFIFIIFLSNSSYCEMQAPRKSCWDANDSIVLSILVFSLV